MCVPRDVFSIRVGGQTDFVPCLHGPRTTSPAGSYMGEFEILRGDCHRGGSRTGLYSLVVSPPPQGLYSLVVSHPP